MIYEFNGFRCQNELRYYRNKWDLSQEDLAKRVGLTQNTISSLETGCYMPSYANAIKLSRFFGVPMECIFNIVFDSDEFYPFS